MSDVTALSADLLAAGRDALARGAWTEAKDRFRRVLEVEESPEALEGYALACYWLDHVTELFDTRERAFHAYRARGDRRSAARVATAIAVDFGDIRGELAVASGWFQRAASLLADIELCDEHGWLEFWQGVVAAAIEGDVARARKHQPEALRLARELKNFDLEMMAVALDGFAMVREGRVEEGLRRLDEATAAAVSGEMSDLLAIGTACCAAIYACEAVADYDRARQWCDRATDFCRRWGLASLFAICRSYYATVLVWRGDWAEAEAQLMAAARELETSRPGNASEALAKLGDLRRRQGRLAEAEELLNRAETHPMSLLGKAALALDRSDPSSALDLVRRFLRRISDEDQAERVFALEVAVRASIAKGDLESARMDQEQAAAAAQAVGTASLRASASLSAGLVALAEGELQLARERFEDAIDLFEVTGNGFDGARARLELARALQALGRPEAATEQAAAALQRFQRVGAAYHAQLAARAAGALPRSGSAGQPRPLPGLTARESEVLWLLVEGRTNQEIADELVLSVRTVERHISTIYEKLDLHGKAARAAATAFALRHASPT
ncbi:MAG TPA: LuxR C-terminal-related transcriptional regulator [Dehalococcoidia bacterium]|nr:LuxR C-terminal-related transcriptional regulator [Dehalococcoidia bacterium]